jgi:hypothetical protein
MLAIEDLTSWNLILDFVFLIASLLKTVNSVDIMDAFFSYK